VPSADSTLSRDPEIRRLLAERLDQRYGGDQGTEICHEFSVCSSRARIDMAVVNGSLAGFEIKSEADRLTRLSSQIPEYNRIFDFVTVVCAPRHLERVDAYVPGWYGIWKADFSAPCPLEPVRDPGMNPEPSIRAVTALLWRAEMLDVLGAHRLADGLTHRPRRVLLEALLEGVPHDMLAAHVRTLLRARLRAARAL
jgi:hypothetical protein